MRKSVSEKIKIVKQATTDKKIKKLAIQHGVTTKTIKKWKRLHNVGLLEQNSNNSKNEFTKKSLRPFENSAFTIVEIDSPYKGNGQSVFRFQLKDIDNGFILAGYYSSDSRHNIRSFMNSIIYSF